MMTQTHIAAQKKMQFQPSLVGELDAPSINLLGSLDDDQGTSGLGLEASNPKVFFAVIYNPS